MNDPRNPNGHFRDLAHAAVLLLLVPVVFYGGYQLVTHSTDVEPNQDHLGTQATEYWSKKPGPPPGATWVAKVDRLRHQLSSTSLTDPGRMKQRNRLDDQLHSIRTHCETHVDSVHNTIDGGTPLGQTLMTIAHAVDRLQDSEATTTLPPSWETQFESSESARLAQQAKEVNDSYEEQAAPIRQAHATQLAAVNRQNRERADELQRILDSIEHIERDARAQIARRERAQAYAQDRNEIARLLQPFITPGTTQLRENWNDWKMTADPKPLSYRDLERVGALATDINGLRTFARIGGMRVHMSPQTARPLGGFPAYYDNTLSNPTHLETIKRAQQLIKQHSVYLIEAGLLQP